MIITPSTIAALTQNTQYNVKWATLQHYPDFIIVTADDGTNATVQFYDSTFTVLLTTKTIPDITVTYIIDLTK